MKSDLRRECTRNRKSTLKALDPRAWANHFFGCPVLRSQPPTKRQRRASYQPGLAAQEQGRGEIMRAVGPFHRFPRFRPLKISSPSFRYNGGNLTPWAHTEPHGACRNPRQRTLPSVAPHWLPQPDRPLFNAYCITIAISIVHQLALLSSHTTRP